MNADTSHFSHLIGPTNFKASPTEIYSVKLTILLSGLATSAYKLGYRLGMDGARTHFALYDAWVDDTLWTGPRWRLLASGYLPAP